MLLLFVLSIQCPWATDVLKRATTSRSFPFHIPTPFQLPNLILMHNFMTQEFYPRQYILRVLNSPAANQCTSMGGGGWFIALFYLLVSSTTKFPQQSPLPPYHGHSLIILFMHAVCPLGMLFLSLSFSWVLLTLPSSTNKTFYSYCYTVASH